MQSFNWGWRCTLIWIKETCHKPRCSRFNCSVDFWCSVCLKKLKQNTQWRETQVRQMLRLILKTGAQLWKTHGWAESTCRFFYNSQMRDSSTAVRYPMQIDASVWPQATFRHILRGPIHFELHRHVYFCSQLSKNALDDNIPFFTQWSKQGTLGSTSDNTDITHWRIIFKKCLITV